ncbi:hypothetical protein M9458_034747, partial [Cirrhinus mrigala]
LRYWAGAVTEVGLKQGRSPSLEIENELKSLNLISSAARGYGTCEIDWTQAVYSVSVKLYVISIFFFNFFVPLFVIVFTYVSIIRTVNSSHKSSRGGDISNRQRKIERSITRVQSSPYEFPLIIEPKDISIYIRVILCFSLQVSLILCAAFLLAWSPYAVISMWSAWGYQIPPLNSILASLFAKSASFYNPFIYIGISSKFRKDLQALFYCLRPTSAHRHTPPVPLARLGDVQLNVDGFKENEPVDHNASENIEEGKAESSESERQDRPLPESGKS